MTFVQLSDGVETAVTGLDEVRGAPLHDEANVGHVDIAQPVDALHLRIDETLFRIFGDSLVNSTMQWIRRWLKVGKYWLWNGYNDHDYS